MKQIGWLFARVDNLVLLRELIEEGKSKAVIDRCYSLEQIAEAHRYVETAYKKGNVVISIQASNPRSSP